MNLKDYFESELEEHRSVLEATSTLGEEFARLADECAKCIKNDGKILIFGNGGSAADAQHIATELTVQYEKSRPAIAAIALSTDTSALTAIGNDFSFDDIFSRQVEALGRPGDVVIGISTSGNSTNVIKAFETAKARGMVVAGLTGNNGGKMAGIADPLVIVPSKRTARIQEMHILIGHILCGTLEM